MVSDNRTHAPGRQGKPPCNAPTMWKWKRMGRGTALRRFTETTASADWIGIVIAIDSLLYTGPQGRNPYGPPLLL